MAPAISQAGGLLSYAAHIPDQVAAMFQMQSYFPVRGVQPAVEAWPVIRLVPSIEMQKRIERFWRLDSPYFDGECIEDAKDSID